MVSNMEMHTKAITLRQTRTNFSSMMNKLFLDVFEIFEEVVKDVLAFELSRVQRHVE